MIKIVIVSLPFCKCGVLCDLVLFVQFKDLVLFVQFKKREKHPQRSFNFSQLYKWYQIAQRITSVTGHTSHRGVELWLNQWSTTTWTSKLYHRKHIFQVYSSIIPKWSFKKLLRAEVSGIMYYFLIYEGKPPKANGYDYFQKSAQVVAVLLESIQP